MCSNTNYPLSSRQKGLSLVELLVAMAIFGLVMAIGISIYNYLNQSRGKALAQLKVQEQYLQAFNLFYRTYNQTYQQGTSTSNYVNLIESPTTSIQIQFISNDNPPSINGTTLTIGSGDPNLNNLLNYFAVPQVNESVSMCMLTGIGSGQESNTWSYKCPNSYSGIQTAFANSSITQLPIAFIDGMICYVKRESVESNGILKIDDTQNNCTFDRISTELNAFNGNWFFELPRIMVYSSDHSFQEPIFESLIAPRVRFSGNNNFYPTIY